MSSPSVVAPKKTRNNCISSGVPWNTWMNPPAARETGFTSETLESATINPPTVPPAKAISDSSTVQRAAVE